MTIHNKLWYTKEYLNNLVANKGLNTGIGELILQYPPPRVIKDVFNRTITLDINFNFIREEKESSSFGWRPCGLFINKPKIFKLTQAQKTIFRAISKNKVGLGKKDQRRQYLKRILKGKLNV